MKYQEKTGIILFDYGISKFSNEKWKKQAIWEYLL